MPIKPTDAGLKRLYSQATTDGKVDSADVEALINSAKDGGSLSKTEKKDLERMLATDANLFEPAAKVKLQTYLGIAPQPPPVTPAPQPPVTPTPPAPQPPAPSTGTVSPARQKLDALIATLSPSTQTTVKNVLGQDDVLSPSDMAHIAFNVGGGGVLPSASFQELMKLGPSLSPEAADVLRSEAGISLRRGANTNTWLYDAKLTEAQAQGMMESRMRGDHPYQIDHRNSALTEVIIAKNDEFTFEARQRIAMFEPLEKTKIAQLTVLLEKNDGLDLSDMLVLERKIRFLGPSEQIIARRGLADAFRLGLKVKPEALSTFGRVTGSTPTDPNATLGAGPVHAGSTIGSRSVFAEKTYVDTPLDVLAKTHPLASGAEALAKRLNQLVSPPVTDGVLRASTLLAAERAPLAQTLSPGERLSLITLWSALEVPTKTRTEAIATQNLRPLESLASVQLYRPRPLDLNKPVTIDASFKSRVGDEALLARLQRVANADNVVTTISLPDFDAVLQGPGVGFTAEDKTRLGELRQQLANRIRSAPALTPASFSIQGPLRKEETHVLNENLGIVAKSTVDFDNEMQLTRRTSITMRNNGTPMIVRDDAGKVVLSTANTGFYSNSTVPMDLKPGTYTVERPGYSDELVSFELPQLLAGKETVDLSKYGGYEMGWNAQPSSRSSTDVEEYYRTITDHFGRQTTQLDSVYWRPSSIKTFLPAGEYQVPGTDLRVLLINRVSSAEVLNGLQGVMPQGNKRTQAVLVDSNGTPVSITGPGDRKLADGRAASISATNDGKVTVRVGGTAYPITLDQRVG